MSNPEHAPSEVRDPLIALVARVRAGRLPAPDECRSIRRAAGLGLRPVAQALGVSPMTVSRWESGTSKPSPMHALRYRQLLNELRRASRSAR